MHSEAAYDMLVEIIGEFESLYAPMMEIDIYRAEDVSVIADEIFSHIEAPNATNTEELLAQVGQAVRPVAADFALLAASTKFYEMPVLVFDGFPGLAEIAKLMFCLTRASYVRRVTSDVYRSLFALLAAIDEADTRLRYTMPYRVLKLVAISTLFYTYDITALLAGFLLSQMAL